MVDANGPDHIFDLRPAERRALWIRTRKMAERWREHGLVHLEGRCCEHGVERADRTSSALVGRVEGGREDRSGHRAPGELRRITHDAVETATLPIVGPYIESRRIARSAARARQTRV